MLVWLKVAWTGSESDFIFSGVEPYGATIMRSSNGKTHENSTWSSRNSHLRAENIQASPTKIWSDCYISATKLNKLFELKPHGSLSQKLHALPKLGMGNHKLTNVFLLLFWPPWVKQHVCLRCLHLGRWLGQQNRVTWCCLSLLEAGLSLQIVNVGSQC